MTSLKSSVGEIIIKQIELYKPEDYDYATEFFKLLIEGWKP